MELISFEDYSRQVSKDAFDPRNMNGHKQEILLETLRESKALEKVLASECFFYPKYLWREDKNVDLYFFTEEKVIVCRLDDGDKVSISSFSLKNVVKTDLTLYDYNRKDCGLTLRFKNGEELSFSSSDSNSSWKYKFYQAIIELHERFL